jgi:drug/metabolite transporter (DMT)-like permease
MGGLSRARTAWMIVGLVLMWGVSWPIYKTALNYTPPILFAGMRCLFGGLLLVIYALPRYKKIRLRQNWHIYLICALLNAVLFFTFQTVGLRYLPSGLFSVIVYVQPVLVGIFAWYWLGESMSGLKIIGLVLGFIGVACISVESLTGKISAVGVLFALGSALSWGLGTIYTKKVGQQADSLWLVAIQFFIGGLVTTGLGLAMENGSHIGWSHLGYLTGLVYGSVFGVAISWLLYFALVRAGEASKVASFTFFTPLVAVLLGTIFLREPFTGYLFLGMLLIVVSILIVNRPSRKSVHLKQEAIEL